MNVKTFLLLSTSVCLSQYAFGSQQECLREAFPEDWKLTQLQCESGGTPTPALEKLNAELKSGRLELRLTFEKICQSPYFAAVYSYDFTHDLKRAKTRCVGPTVKATIRNSQIDRKILSLTRTQPQSSELYNCQHDLVKPLFANQNVTYAYEYRNNSTLFLRAQEPALCAGSNSRWVLSAVTWN